MIVISAEDLVENGGILYATRKVTKKIKDIFEAEKIYVKFNTCCVMYKKINVTTSGDIVKITFRSPSGKRLIVI